VPWLILSSSFVPRHNFFNWVKLAKQFKSWGEKLLFSNIRKVNVSPLRADQFRSVSKLPQQNNHSKLLGVGKIN